MPRPRQPLPPAPTRTIRKAGPPKPKSNLSTNQQLEADLKELEAREKALKKVIRGKGYSYTKIMKNVNEIIGKDEPIIEYIKNLRYGGKEFIRFRINENKYENRFYSLKKVKELSQQLSNKLNDKGVNGKLMTSLVYGDLSWKSGYLRNLGNEVELYDPNKLYNLETPYATPKTIPAFDIYVMLGNKDAGGLDDEYNDCLYNCLKYYIFDLEKYFKNPAELKTFCGVGRKDLIPKSKIDDIEKKLKTFQINIRGDYIRSSPVKSNKIININLINQHYSVEKVENKFLKFIRYEEKEILLYDKKTFEVYDGKNKWTLTKKEFNEIAYNKFHKYILVYRKKQGIDEDGNKIVISIKEEYKNYIEIADALKKESNGMINLYKTGSYHDTALNLFDRITKFINPENILQDEALWINYSFQGGIIWADEYEGELYKYDVKSLYPYLMKLSTLKFPIQRGEFRIIEDFNKFVEFGIYRCIIHKSEDENLNRLFNFNNTNYYTSIDIFNANELNLKVELIKDGEPNFLYYSRDKLITFNEVFDNYVDLLFPLKENKVKGAKDILNILWGALCGKDKKKKFINDTCKTYEIPEDEEIIEIYPSNDDKGLIIKTVKINNMYKTPYARLGTFLTSQGRRQMAKILLPEKDNVKRVQTDGFLTTKPIHKNIKVGMGELKYEGFTTNGKIENCINKVKVEY